VATVAAVVLVVVALSQNGGGDDEAAAPAEPALALEAEESQADAAAPGAGEDAAAEAVTEAAPAEPPAEAAEPPAAEPAPPVVEATAPEDAARQTVRSVAGAPAEIAERLRQQGLDARAVDGAVEVEGSDPDAVAKAIEEYPDGDVAVVVVPGA
jgi:hypothetical protein